MRSFDKPKLFVSRCLGFDACRWNGQSIPDKFVDKLKPYVEFITECPESSIGLGVPRDPVRIVRNGEKFRLLQLNTGRDVTSEMASFCSQYVSFLSDIDGFILKDRSPSCGMKDVKVYAGLEPGSTVASTSGFFATEVERAFAGYPVETEMRLTNYNLRENFLTRIFLFASFRQLCSNPSMKALIEFHSDNKLLFMAYNQTAMREMGRIVANHELNQVGTVIEKYRKVLIRALSKLPKYTSNINVLMHAFGYFSKDLTAEEKRFFINTLEEYRREQIPLSVPLNLVRSYIIRFREDYLARQTFFEPYPQEFMFVTDSGKGRSR